MTGTQQKTGAPGQRRRKSQPLAIGAIETRQPRPSEASASALQAESGEASLTGEFIGKDDKPPDGRLQGHSASDDDEAVVRRVEHLNRDVGWALISAGLVGLVMPGVLGAPFLIMGALVLWPGNRKRAERWRQGHSPKIFHGAMRQINRFLDDLDKRYPRIEKD